MNHYSERLETELASGILRAEQTFFVDSQCFLILSSRNGGARRYSAITFSYKGKLNNRKGKKSPGG